LDLLVSNRSPSDLTYCVPKRQKIDKLVPERVRR
jgi:hypothetical protein